MSLNLKLKSSTALKTMELRLKKLPNKVLTRVRSTMAEAGAEMETELKHNLNIGGRGKKVKGKRVVTHSKQGEFPRKQSAGLQRSIGFKVNKIGGSIRMKFGSIRRGKKPVNYAEDLETKSPKRGGRPWLMRTVKPWIPKIKKRIKQSLKGLDL